MPSAPTAVSGTAGDARVSLVWTPPTDAFGLSDYSIQYRVNTPGSSWTTIVSPGTTAAATVTPLDNGTTYVFRVAAVTAPVARLRP